MTVACSQVTADVPVYEDGRLSRDTVAIGLDPARTGSSSPVIFTGDLLRFRLRLDLHNYIEDRVNETYRLLGLIRRES